MNHQLSGNSSIALDELLLVSATAVGRSSLQLPTSKRDNVLEGPMSKSWDIERFVKQRREKSPRRNKNLSSCRNFRPPSNKRSLEHSKFPGKGCPESPTSPSVLSTARDSLERSPTRATPTSVSRRKVGRLHPRMNHPEALSPKSPLGSLDQKYASEIEFGGGFSPVAHGRSFAKVTAATTTPSVAVPGISGCPLVDGDNNDAELRRSKRRSKSQTTTTMTTSSTPRGSKRLLHDTLAAWKRHERCEDRLKKKEHLYQASFSRSCRSLASEKKNPNLRREKSSSDLNSTMSDVDRYFVDAFARNYLRKQTTASVRQ